MDAHMTFEPSPVFSFKFIPARFMHQKESDLPLFQNDMKTLFLSSTLCLLALGASAQDTPDNHVAAAGERIGRVFIGDSKAAVERRLGPPSRTFALGRGLSSELWRGKKPSDSGGRNTLEVVYRGGFATQIEGTSLVWKTPGGLSLSSSRADWEEGLGAPSVSTYDYRGGVRKRYLDWRRAGVALELVRGADSDSSDWTYQKLIVHRTGSPVIPTKGGERE